MLNSRAKGINRLLCGGDFILYEKRITNRGQLREMLDIFDLSDVENTDYTVGIFDDNQQLLGFGSLRDDIIVGVVVNKEAQREGISAKIISHLIKAAAEQGKSTLHIFTKPEKAHYFVDMGFRKIAEAPPYTTMLEWGDYALEEYLRYLKSRLFENCPEAAVIVINANPFTNGHKYLVEKAAGENDYVYVVVVEEDCSLFPFEARLALVQKCTAHLSNVRVLSGGRYLVSALTFPSYFTQEHQLAFAHASLDIALFATHIAPTLNIKTRYIGTEPYNETTYVYNEIIKQLLPTIGIYVVEIARVGTDGEIISASAVRHLFSEPVLTEQNMVKLRSLVPPPAYAFIVDHWVELVSRSAQLLQGRIV